MKYLIPILVLSSQLALADSEADLLKKSAQKAISTIKEVNLPLLSPLDCLNAPALTKPIECAAISDNFCQDLWNDQNNGNLKVFDGEIKAGKSSISGANLSTFANDQALIKSLTHLTPDIKEAIGPSIVKLEAHLKNEANNTKWFRDYSQIKQDLTNSIEDLTEARFNKKYAPSNVNDYAKWTIQESNNYEAEKRAVYDEITKAKYEKDPNWLRVEKLYPEAKLSLLKVIEALSIPAEDKKKMKDKLESVGLSLPLQDTSIIGADQACSETTVNAFYSPYNNKFTVCAGMFNRYQSDSALVFVLIHELGHSIDSGARSRDESRSNAPISLALNKLKGKANQTYQCSEWKKINNDIVKAPLDFVPVKNSMEKLYSCLRGNPDLEDMELDGLTKASKQIARNILSDYAGDNSFSKLLEKKVKVDKKIKDNEVYYRPDLLSASNNTYFENSQQTRDVNPLEIFMQNFYCALEDQKLNKESFEAANKKERSEIFDKAMAQTSKILELRLIEAWKYCGKNCSALTQFGMSADPDENTADWFANKSFPDFLKTLKPENRAQASALATSLFCPTGLESSDLTLAEKKYSLETHPDSRHRRISLYTPETSKALGCIIDEKDQGDAKCSP